MMVSIRATAMEQGQQQLGEANLNTALSALETDGLVLLKQVVPHHLLDTLQQSMDRDTSRLLAFLASQGGNPRTEGHLQQGPPLDARHVFPEVIANPFARQIAAVLLGKDCYLTFYNGNTNCPGSRYQAVHLDNPHLDDGTRTAKGTYSLVINVPTADCSAANGATEVWPGSHRVTGIYPDNNVTAPQLATRRRQQPPLTCASEKGDLVIRDTRLWHRGVPNPGQHPRHMIASVYTAGWRVRRGPVKFQQDCATFMETIDFDFNAEFVTAPIDYLLGPSREILRREGSWRNDALASARLAENQP